MKNDSKPWSWLILFSGMVHFLDQSWSFPHAICILEGISSYRDGTGIVGNSQLPRFQNVSEMNDSPNLRMSPEIPILGIPENRDRVVNSLSWFSYWNVGYPHISTEHGSLYNVCLGFWSLQSVLLTPSIYLCPRINLRNHKVQCCWKGLG